MIITLTTDFGLADPFVGIMKGVILGIAPSVQIVDVTHEVRPYNLVEAAFVLYSSFSYFPTGTVHVIVVDPGVGTDRRPIAASSEGHVFIAPDNGILSFVLGGERARSHSPVYHVTNESLVRRSKSRTFDGRDVFAPVAANLARGVPIENVGPQIVDFVRLQFPQPQRRGNKFTATILRIDKFGNIITNLRRDHLEGSFSIRVAGVSVSRFCSTFADAEPSQFFAFEGSTGFIEIGLRQASAADMLKVTTGAEIELESNSPNK